MAQSIAPGKCLLWWLLRLLLLLLLLCLLLLLRLLLRLQLLLLLPREPLTCTKLTRKRSHATSIASLELGAPQSMVVRMSYCCPLPSPAECGLTQNQ